YQEMVNEIEVNDFVIIETSVKNPEIETEETEKSPMLVFDFPINQDKNTPAIEDIEVRDSIEIIPVTEISEEGEKRYSLDDYQQVEDLLMNSKPGQKISEDVVDEELVFEKKTASATDDTPAVSEEEADPVNSSISDLLKKRTEERKAKMKAFNYKFSNHTDNHIEELEKQPAYKRMGIELDQDGTPKTTLSKTTLSVDENDDIVLRNNNSFLHDNVD